VPSARFEEEAEKYQGRLKPRLKWQGFLNMLLSRGRGLIDTLTDGAEEFGVRAVHALDALDEQLQSAKAKADEVGQDLENTA
jgi:hypothetical protein